MISSGPARIFQFQLVLEIKIGLGVVTDGEFQFISDISNYTEVGIHIKIKSTGFPCSFGKSRILDVLALVTGKNIYISLRTDINFSISENPVKQIIRSTFSLGRIIFRLSALSISALCLK